MLLFLLAAFAAGTFVGWKFGQTALDKLKQLKDKLSGK